MSAADLAILVPAIVAFLTAATALLVRLARRSSSSSAGQKPPDVPCSHDQSCPPGGK